MNQLERFLQDLNLIQQDTTSQNEKLTDYLFNSNGWTILFSMYCKKYASAQGFSRLLNLNRLDPSLFRTIRIY